MKIIMKKISRLSTISSVIALAFIVPQIAFAAWWNPLSWNIFRGTDTKTQILETRANDSEITSDSTASSTVSESKDTQKLTNEAPKVLNASWWNPLSWFKRSSETSEIEKLRNEVEELKKKTATSDPTVVGDKSKATTKPVTPVSKQTISVSELKKQAPQEYKALVDENKTQLLEASKLLLNKNIIARVKPSVTYIETTDGSGSGVIIGADGYILTNAHVVSGVSYATVKLSNGGSYRGTVVGRDENIDLALLQISATGLSAAFLGDSDSVEQGDPVFTFGYPLGIEGDVAFKDGTLSRRQKIDGTAYLEISAQILPGSSGGPLVNQSGEVIGINTLAVGALKISGVLIGETLKFALPINVAKNLIPELKNGRNIELPKKVVITPVAPTPAPQPTPQPVTPQPTPTPAPAPAPISPPAQLPVPVVIPQGSNKTLFRFKLSDGDYIVKSLTFSKAIGGGDPAPTIVGMYLGYKLGTDCRSSNVVQSPIKSAFDSLNEITFVFPTPNTCKEFWLDIQTGDGAPTSASIQYNLIGGELRTPKDNLSVVAPQYSTTINYGTPSPPNIYLWSSGKIAKVGQEFVISVRYLKNGATICDVPITYSGPDISEKVENTGPIDECLVVIRYTPVTLGTQTLIIKAQGLEKTLEIEVNP